MNSTCCVRMLFLACALMLVGCEPSAREASPKPTETADLNNRWEISGADTWVIDGDRHKILTAYLIPAQERTPAQLTINYACNCGAMELTQAEAAERAQPLFEYVVQNDLHRSDRVRELLGEDSTVGRIGVAVLDVDGARQRGTGVWMTPTEIEQDL